MLAKKWLQWKIIYGRTVGVRLSLCWWSQALNGKVGKTLLMLRCEMS